MIRSFRLGVLALVAASWLRGTARADVLITEFQAANVTTLADEDGEYSDWIEIYNSGTEAVNLAGWSLTDSAEDLAKWKFPDASLEPGRFLVVFASGKDRAVRQRELHTNFKLDPDGQYLALVRPDGVTLASEFAPKYPFQIDDVSYGVPVESTASALLTSPAPAKTFVPTDDSLGRTWTEPGFDDASWIAGDTGIGFDKKTTPTYTEMIQTNIEAQMWKVNTSAYIRVPFSVDDPSQVNVALLRMKYEDGFFAYLNGTEVARRLAPPSPLWNSKATTRRLEKDAVVFEDINISQYLSALRQGTNVLAIQGLNDSSSGTTSDFVVLPEVRALKVESVQTGARLFFSKPTPGLPNGTEGAPGVAAPPQFSLPAGTYPDPISLELRSDVPQATIRYTTDRTEPTEASPLYQGALAIAATTVVRAKVFAPDLLPSAPVSSAYVLLNANVKDFSSNLPLMIINSYGKAIPEDPKVYVTVTVLETPGGRTNISDPPVLISQAGIKKRGSSSLGFPKNHYSLEIWDERNVDRDVELFDMPKEADWILNGPYDEKTLMRDYLAYDWSNKMGRWASRCRFFELFLDQSGGAGGTRVDAADYWGVYVFMDKIKRGDHRVDLKKLHASETSEPEVSGGYILKNDRLDPGDTGLRTKRGQQLGYVYPKEKEATAAQKVYITRYLDEFETALYGANFKDPDSGYAKYIDVDAFIDQHILVELCKNIDGYRLSTYMYKDREGKLAMGPAWDYNLSLGNADYLNGWDPTGWYYPLIGTAQEYPWYPRLFQDPAFVERYKRRWLELRDGPIQTEKLHAQIEDIAAYLDEAQKRNFTKWRVLGIYVWPNKFIGKTYREEIDFMKGWLRDRIAWMDGTFLTPPAFSQSGGQVERGFKLKVTAPAGDIYYTLTGSDPVGAGGAPAADSILYADPEGITINANTRVRARVKAGSIWSAIREGTFITDPAPLAITEVMFNPGPPPEGSAFRAVDFKYIEIQNVGTAPYDLTGVRFSKGVAFDFTGSAVTSLGPDEFVVIVKKKAAFESLYGSSGIQVAGEWAQDLSTSGEGIAFNGSLDETIIDFTYSGSWYPDTSAQGHSLVLVDPHGPRDKTFLNKKEAWRPSSELNGSPGKEDPPAPTGGLQRPGDVSQDGALNITDAIAILRYLFQGLLTSLPCGDGSREDPGNLKLADVDGDGGLNLTDAVDILRFLFQEGVPPSLGTGCVRLPGCPDACGE